MHQQGELSSSLMCRVPFYIAAPTTTLDPNMATGSLIKIEERDSREVTHHQGIQVAAPGINVGVRLLCQFLADFLPRTAHPVF